VGRQRHRRDGSSDDETAVLLERAANRDDEAWSTLIDRFERVVWSVTHGFALDEATRHDVFQLTWLRLIDNVSRIREPDRLAGWLVTTARRECLAAVESSRREVPTQRLSENESTTDHPGQALIRDEEVAGLLEALGQIGERCQQLLRLLTLDPPLTYQEIASILDIPVGTIGPTRARCLERLRRRPAIVRINDRDHRSEEKQERLSD
jgi:RNA polymerase sigma factor (sigma-70 family)